jgi:hypothetical protein
VFPDLKSAIFQTLKHKGELQGPVPTTQPLVPTLVIEREMQDECGRRLFDYNVSTDFRISGSCFVAICVLVSTSLL